MTSEAQEAGFVLRVEHLSKSFPGVQALTDVSLGIRSGRVHALMGENGAGKSTLMKILAGLVQPDSGAITFHGNPTQFRNPHEALKGGISMIHQELMPFPDLTVAENILMGQEPTGRFPGWIDQRRLNVEARALLGRLGSAIPPTRLMRELGVAEIQTVEIAKALAHRAEVVIMDEPTSALSYRESERLFAVIQDLKQRGVAVIYISHKLEEVFRIADTVTVLRDGCHVATRATTELDVPQLIALMVGRELRSEHREARAPRGAATLTVRGLSKAGRFREVSFDVHSGEVLGMAGLMGAGRTDVAHALCGLASADAGEIQVRGQTVRIASPHDALAHGIGLVGEDRKEFGLVSTMSVKHNLTLARLDRCCRGPWINRDKEDRTADDRIREFAIKVSGPDQQINQLSGGNQQKVVIAKTLLAEPDVLVLDEPTRGIDIGAKAEVYAIIRRLARAGKAVIMISSELPEILSLSDRILVLRGGVISAELDPLQTSQDEILKHAMPES